MASGISRIRYANYFVNFQEIKYLNNMNKTFQETIHEDIITELRKLILFNSNHVWDDVVCQLEKATGFDEIKCEQIAMFAHTKGKAVVKSGGGNELEKINTILREINLVTSIE